MVAFECPVEQCLAWRKISKNDAIKRTVKSKVKMQKHKTVRSL